MNHKLLARPFSVYPQKVVVVLLNNWTNMQKVQEKYGTYPTFPSLQGTNPPAQSLQSITHACYDIRYCRFSRGKYGYLLRRGHKEIARKVKSIARKGVTKQKCLLELS